jgi:hypothetical protein
MAHGNEFKIKRENKRFKARKKYSGDKRKVGEEENSDEVGKKEDIKTGETKEKRMAK